VKSPEELPDDEFEEEARKDVI